MTICSGVLGRSGVLGLVAALCLVSFGSQAAQAARPTTKALPAVYAGTSAAAPVQTVAWRRYAYRPYYGAYYRPYAARPYYYGSYYRRPFYYGGYAAPYYATPYYGGNYGAGLGYGYGPAFGYGYRGPGYGAYYW